jgi:hypothetical protein
MHAWNIHIYEDYCLLGCDSVQSVRYLPLFQGNLLPPSSAPGCSEMVVSIYQTTLQSHHPGNCKSILVIFQMCFCLIQIKWKIRSNSWNSTRAAQSTVVFHFHFIHCLWFKILNFKSYYTFESDSFSISGKIQNEILPWKDQFNKANLHQ